MNIQKFGLTIEEVAASGPIGRTLIFRAIKEGKLKARKAGRRTFILPEDYETFLRSLPVKEAA